MNGGCGMWDMGCEIGRVDIDMERTRGKKGEKRRFTSRLSLEGGW